jgi:hypothetical protein
MKEFPRDSGRVIEQAPRNLGCNPWIAASAALLA